ncbi:MAG: dockerin type I repeat-containing protein [Ruminococcus sp.]|nr:dockerin type I repeat-containing protein [Ruminococcus sp.]
MKNKLFITALSAVMLSLSTGLIPFQAKADVSIKGDVNLDGDFNISDVVLLQKWILDVPNVKLANQSGADLCNDGKIDIFDLCLMKKMLKEKAYSREQAQKTFLNGLYYVKTSGKDGYMGFEFWSDGRFTKYDFDDFGDVIYGTMITTDYEIAGNKFSFGDVNKKSATIVNQNDTGNFSVQFDDGSVFNFSTEKPKFRKTSHVSTKPDTLNGTIWSWYGDWDMDYNFSEYIEKRKIEFKEDGVSGTVYIALYPHDAAKRKITEIPFTYEQNGDEVTFYMEDSAYTILNARISVFDADKKLSLDIEYQNGDRNFFALTGYLNN